LPELGSRPAQEWEKQFEKLKEAIVFLLSYSLLRETEGRTILSRIVDVHRQLKGMRSAYYDDFGEALIDTVVEADKGGNNPDNLRKAWMEAIKPGLDYLKTEHTRQGPSARSAHPGTTKDTKQEKK
jgi:hypothetical protein